LKLKLTYTLLLFFGILSNISATEVLQKKIGFYVNHSMANVNGICNEIQIEPFDLIKKSNVFSLKSSFKINIPITKISSGDSGRDDHIHEILGHPNFSQIQIQVSSIENQGEKYLVKGNLTIRGITKPFQSDATAVETNGNVQVDGKLVTKFSDYKLENPSLLFFKAKEEIEISYSFLLK
jgi:hypothetical protein